MTGEMDHEGPVDARGDLHLLLSRDPATAIAHLRRRSVTTRTSADRMSGTGPDQLGPVGRIQSRRQTISDTPSGRR